MKHVCINCVGEFEANDCVVLGPDDDGKILSWCKPCARETIQSVTLVRVDDGVETVVSHTDFQKPVMDA